ncbi:MAG: hypothetical protein ACD_2C00221G0009 [uncultured bacterium (gcode 4)]|uniref:Uncharacterized protein n=1 Tax=uncultured bacterium (gcode 4) TaxID=1234023 RepID=K2G495_9BACT|nr:MAG: hypothetical protein ACD_2C00221G0009 [uncultured bacterium (gcode 4)]
MSTKFEINEGHDIKSFENQRQYVREQAKSNTDFFVGFLNTSLPIAEKRTIEAAAKNDIWKLKQELA